MHKLLRGILGVIGMSALVACGGQAPGTGEARSDRSALMRVFECERCPTPKRIEEENDPSGCGVGETCNPPGAGGGNITCTDADTSHEGNPCNGPAAIAD
jgi:hypothetical protein